MTILPLPENDRDAADRVGDIAAIDLFPVRMPLRKPLVMSTYRLDDGPSLFVRVRTRSGAHGWGEAAASPVMAGETLAGMVAAVDQLVAPQLIDRSAFDRARLMRQLRGSVHANGGALAAVDMALLDLVGRLRGVPAVELLGGALRHRVDPLWLVGGSGSPEVVVQEALALRGQGFSAFKLKVGVASLADEIRTVRLLREALGEACLIAADANMAWDVATALRFARAAAEFGLAFLEQPVPAGDLARMTMVGRTSPVPVAIDESLHGTHDVLTHAAAGAIGGVSLKTIKLGGIAPLVSLAATCDLLGLSVNLAMMMESSLASAAMIHAACAVPNVDWGLSLGHLWLAADVTTSPIVCMDGAVACPTGPGLGVEVEEHRLRALAA